MFLIDDLLLAPGKAMMYMVSEVAKQAQNQWLDDEPVKRELRELYMMLDSGRISEQEFDGRERLLVERLEEISRLKPAVR